MWSMHQILRMFRMKIKRTIQVGMKPKMILVDGVHMLRHKLRKELAPETK